ncbi:MAG: MATE family efflux transporter [Bacteroidia bacterium]
MDTQKTSYKYILQIALPIILGGLAENIINVTDTAFVGRLGVTALGAVGMGGLYYYTFVLIAVGLSQGAQIIIGRRNGEKSYGEAGALLDNSLYLFGGIGIALFLLLQLLSPLLLNWLIQSPEVFSQCITYVNIRSYGVLFICLTVVFRAFFIGITHTRVITVITIIMALVNVVFDYLLIFGEYGFPKMGIAGAAWASVMAEFVAIAGYIIYALYSKHTQKFRLFRFPKIDIQIAKNILSVGFPLMLQSWISVSSWFVFFLLIEKMGEHSLAVSSIIKSIYILFMIPIWGFSSAANTLVSNAMGAERQHEVIGVLRKILILSGGVTFLLVQVNFLFPAWLPSIYSTDENIIRESLGPLWVVSITLIIYSLGSVLFQAVSGTGATKVSLRLELITLALYMLFIFTVGWIYTLPLIYIWLSEFVYTGSLLVGSFIYLRSGKWKSIRL